MCVKQVNFYHRYFKYVVLTLNQRVQTSKMATSSVLPTHQRYINGVPVPQSRKTLRLKEKYIIVLVFISFGLVCFGAFMFLPDLGVQVRQKQIDAASDIFFPQPENDANSFKNHPNEADDAHEFDRNRLNNQIKNDIALHEQLNIPKDEHDNLKNDINEDKAILKKKQEDDHREKNLIVEKDHDGHEGAQGGIPSDEETKQRQAKVREVGNR